MSPSCTATLAPQIFEAAQVVPRAKPRRLLLVANRKIEVDCPLVCVEHASDSVNFPFSSFHNVRPVVKLHDDVPAHDLADSLHQLNGKPAGSRLSSR